MNNMKNSLKILMVDKFYFIKGGAERYFFELKAILESHGHQVIPFSMQHSENFQSEFNSYFVSNIEFNHKSFLKRMVDGPKIFERVIYSSSAKKKIEELIEQVKPDIAHVHMIDHQLSPSILHSLKGHGIPIVQTVHQYKLVCPNYLLYNTRTNTICEKCLHGSFYHPIFERCHKNSSTSGILLALEMYAHKILRIYDNIDLFHTPSTFMKNKLIAGGTDEQKIKKLYYTIKIAEYPFSPNHDDYFVYYGRLSKEKGLLTLLKAMKEIDRSKLLIMGDGPQRPQLLQFTQENKLGNVCFIGSKGGEELKSIVANSKFVIVPSEWYENSPLVIYESFSMGKPVIGAAIGGISELIDHEENGLLFQAGDSEALRQQINRLLDHPEEIQEFGNNARRKAEREFNPDYHYDKVLEIYNGVING
jgi:glycosyltransferase involved in cell wall biosynthesis